MFRFRALLAAGLCLALSLVVSAQTKSPADEAAESFFKLRDDREAKVDQARLQRIMAAGLDFLSANPTHGRAWNVITALASHPGTLRDRKLVPLREYWIATLKFEIVNRRTARDQSEDQLAAWAALGAAVAGNDARMLPNRENFEAYRTALDRLAEQPKASRFAVNAEREYLRFLFDQKSPRLDPQLKKLLGGSDKRLAAMAKEEQNIFTARTTPWDMKFTALDGKEFDAATARGKALALVFFSAKRETAGRELDAITKITALYKDLVVVGVAIEGEDERADVEKFVKAQRLPWPVLLGGPTKDNEFAQRLNARNVPATYFFDKAGQLTQVNLRTDRLEGEIKKVLGIK